MSREIKFRVLDTQQIRFLKIHDYIDETWQFNGVAGCGNIGILAYQIRENGVLNSKLICDNERFKIEQFTGLYDKDKTEIYEGDIVERSLFDLKKGDYTRKSEVHFLEGAFCIYTEDWFSQPLSDDIAKECKIIGNIYENPQLLGEQK